MIVNIVPDSMKVISFFSAIFIWGSIHSQSPYRDLSYGNSGMAEITLPEAGLCNDLICMQDGSSVLIGHSYANEKEISFIKLKYNGEIDTTYGINGVQLVGLTAPFNEIADKCRLLPDGGIICAGYIVDANDILPEKGLIIKMTSSGFPDSTFGSEGIVEFTLPGNTDVSLSGIGFDENGNIYAAGNQYFDSPMSYQPLIYKVDSNGVADPNFNPLVLNSYNKAVFWDIDIYANQIFAVGYNDENFQPICHQFFSNGMENTFFAGNFNNSIVGSLVTDQIPGNLGVFNNSVFFTSFNGLHDCNLTRLSFSGNIDTSYGYLGSFHGGNTGLYFSGTMKWINNNSYNITYEYNHIKIFGARPDGTGDNAWCDFGVLADSVPAYGGLSDGAFNVTPDGKLMVALSTDTAITGSWVSVIRYSPSLIGIEEESEWLSIFPNPCSESIYLKGITAGEFKISDLCGKLVLKDSFVDRIDVSQLVEGVYFLEINSEGKTRVSKFLKQ